MRMFLVAGSSLAPVFCVATAGAVDITLGGSIDMGIEFGLGKNNSDLSVQGGYNEVTLSISAAHTTDGGLAFGGAFGLSTSAEIEFKPYADAAGDKYLEKLTVDGRTNIKANLWNVSGGVKVPSNDVVSVKINSNWLSVDARQTAYALSLSNSFDANNICKLAGIGTNRGPALFYHDFENVAPTGNSSRPISSIGAGFSREYWPAAQLGYIQRAVQPAGQPAKKANRFFGGSRYQVVFTTRNSAQAGVSMPSPQTDWFSVPANTGTESENHFKRISRGYVKWGAPTGITRSANSVTNAQVFVGPFMEVKMASSDTKMVVGAACLEGQEDSETAFYMDNVSKVMAASDASIYIEGGFGKLTLQSSDYTGGVSAIAGAGDQADIDADGMVVVAQGYGLLGASPFLAMDLNKGDSLGNLEIITGGTFDLGGLSAAFDVALDNPSDVFGISAWDLGGSYAMGDLALGFATDSSSSWGLSAAMDIAGLGVSTTFGSSSPGDHKKTGITYSVGVTAELSGYNLAVGFDQDLQPTVGVDYDLGGLKLYGKYDAGDEGGSVGATLSF